MLHARVFALVFALFLAGVAILAPAAVHAGSPPAPPAAAAAQDAPAAPPVVATVRVRGLNARSGPGTGYGVLAVLRAGDQVDVLGQVDNCGWLHVRRAGDPELLGWIAGSSAYVTLSVPCGDISPVDAPNAAPVSEPPPATPEPPATGTIILDRRPPGGAYELRAINHTANDGVATLVVPGTTDPIIAFYVRRGEEWTVGGIPGSDYEFKFTTGDQWNSKVGRFAVAGKYWLAASPLEFGGQEANFRGYFITMHEVDDGNMGKQQIGPAQFPDLSQP